jgi:hypothetical protein
MVKKLFSNYSTEQLVHVRQNLNKAAINNIRWTYKPVFITGRLHFFFIIEKYWHGSNCVFLCRSLKSKMISIKFNKSRALCFSEMHPIAVIAVHGNQFFSDHRYFFRKRIVCYIEPMILKYFYPSWNHINTPYQMYE